jgi:hypothetical protein
MKKILMVLGILGVGSLSIPLTGMAAEATTGNPDPEYSDVTVVIKQGTLTIDSVPPIFDFGETNVRDVAEDGVDLPISTDITNQPVSVSDYRGYRNPANGEWALTAALSAIKLDNNEVTTHNTLNATLKFNGTPENTVNFTPDAISLVAGEPAISIAGTKGSNGVNTNDLSFTSATLSISKQDVYAGKYTGTITWTLTNSYTAE